MPRKKVAQPRPKGLARKRVVLSIVETDSTFEVEDHDGYWVGNCIHCNRKLAVAPDGTTDATVEHINPLCHGGEATDPRNLALACRGCNNEKGVRHDQHAGKGGRADQVIGALLQKRASRWRKPR